VRRFVILPLSIALFSFSTDALAHADGYPMNASEYREKSETRLSRYRERLEARMKEHSIAEAPRDAARKKLGTMEAILRATAARAMQDGTVTEAEAEQIKELGKRYREELYRDLGFERGKGE
jgi:hypothetical protein